MDLNEIDLKKALELLQKAEAQIKAARSLLGASEDLNGATKSPNSFKVESLKHYAEEESQIVEGYFDGQNMLGPDGQKYPVAANYASKSKLIQGDKLKLTISPNGSFLYKQIEPCPRKISRGVLVLEDGEYHVVSEGRSYKVLMASVTYHRGKPGDEVSLMIPESGNAEWGAIEAIIPQMNHTNIVTNSSDLF